jgi:hypothetical protein
LAIVNNEFSDICKFSQCLAAQIATPTCTLDALLETKQKKKHNKKQRKQRKQKKKQKTKNNVPVTRTRSGRANFSSIEPDYSPGN